MIAFETGKKMNNSRHQIPAKRGPDLRLVVAAITIIVQNIGIRLEVDSNIGPLFDPLFRPEYWLNIKYFLNTKVRSSYSPKFGRHESFVSFSTFKTVLVLITLCVTLINFLPIIKPIPQFLKKEFSS